MRYKTSGVCSSAIELSWTTRKNTQCKIPGCCSGNTQRCPSVEGMEQRKRSAALRESAAVYVLHPARISYQKL